MFVRKKKNKSGVISVQVIDKSKGKYKVVKTIGHSSDLTEIERLVQQGDIWINKRLGRLSFDFDNEESLFSRFISGIEQINVVGTELLLGKLFDQIGFNQVQDALFRQLVLARLSFPFSKLKTANYLQQYYSLSFSEDQIYRYLDKLHRSQKEIVQQISYAHTLKVLNNNISIVFYDVTTLYFEIDHEDDLRKTGFSKEGKHQNPQIVLGLLVSLHGYPLAYEIFEGNKFEGHTMLPVIDAFKKKYNLNQLVIIADSGLMSNDNIEQLKKHHYDFILGARIKNERDPIKKRILSLKLADGTSKVLDKEDGTRLVINYSATRAKKDQANREKGLRKLEKKVKSGKLSKSNINNKGYNKYLKLDGRVQITIDYDKFKADEQWDGLKGYLTNTSLPKEEVIENYAQLWRIEQAFRVSKNDIRIRPVFHWKKRRIEAHICIAFVAYKIYKELERQLKEKKSSLSPEKAIEIAKTIYSVKARSPVSQKMKEETLYLNEEQKELARLFEF